MLPYLLLLDDSDQRHDAFDRALGDVVCVLHAFSAQEAIELLKVPHIILCMLVLDHDLGNEALVGSGAQVANWIGYEMPVDRFPAQAIVISHNSPGAENIASKLRSAGVLTRVEPYSEDLVKRLVVELQPQ